MLLDCIFVFLWFIFLLMLCIVMFDLYEYYLFVFFFKQKTAYEMRISDWSSDVCSSDLVPIESKCAAEHHHSKGLAGALCMPDDAAFPGAICAKLFHPLDGCPDAEILRMARDLPDAALKNSEAPHQVEQTLGPAQGLDRPVLRRDTPLPLRCATPPK